MKKLGLLITFTAALTLLTSCTAENPAQSYIDRYNCDPYHDSAYIVADDTSAVCVYDNKIYTSGESIGYYDLQNDFTYTTLVENDPDVIPAERYVSEWQEVRQLGDTPLLDVNKNGIYYASGTTAKHYDLSGNLVKSYEIPALDGWETGKCGAFSGSGGYDFMIVRYYKRDEEGREIDGEAYLYIFDENGIITEKSIKKTEGFTFSRVINLYPGENDEEIYVHALVINKDIDVNGIYAVYKINLKTGGFTFTHEFKGGEESTVIIGEKWGASGITRGFEVIENDDFTSLRAVSYSHRFETIKKTVMRTNGTVEAVGAKDIAFTGYNFVEWDYCNNVVLFWNAVESDSGENLTVLVPEKDFNRDGTYLGAGTMDSALFDSFLQFEEENDVSVKQIGIDSAVFVDKVRMKMLAGDDDYDVVLLEQAPELLEPILRYQLYLPLENYKKITSGFQRYMDGIDSLMTYDGHLYGIPYHVTGSKLAVEPRMSELGLKIPDSDTSLDEFWQICAEADDIGEGIMNERMAFGLILSNVVEDGLQNNNLTREAVESAVNKWLDFCEKRVFNGEYGSPNLMRETYATYFAEESSSDNDIYTAVPTVTDGGKRYFNVEKMIYANAKTKNPDLAAEYLALLLSEDYISSVKTFSKSFLVKDTMSYFTYTIGNFENGYKKIKKPFMLDSRVMKSIDAGGVVFKNAAPRLYTWDMIDNMLVTGEFGSYFKSIADKLLEGSMTADEAIEQIYTDAKYKILE